MIALLHGLTVALIASVFVDAHIIALRRRDLGLHNTNGTISYSTLNSEIRRAHVKIAKNNRILAAATPERFRSKLLTRDVVQLDESTPQVWTGQIKVGTPAQTFIVVFDTGSSDMTIPVKGCANSKCDQKRRYDPLASSSNYNYKKTITSSFADGSESIGTWMRDNVFSGGEMARNTSFLAATSLSSTVRSLPSDGIVGMSYFPLSSTRTHSVPFSMFYTTGRGQFGFRLSETPGKSQLYLGTVPSSAYIGQPTWYPVANTEFGRTYWQISNSAPLVNGVQAMVKRANYIIDSATVLIIAPVADAKEFWKSVPDSKQWDKDSSYYHFPCSKPPKVTFSFNNDKKTLTVNDSDFNLGYLPEDPSRCVGAIVGRELGLGTSWLLGDMFMKSYFTIFDMSNNRIGFAPPA